MTAQPSQRHSLPRRSDVAIIGGGLAGAAVAWLVKQRLPGASIAIYEREDELLAHGSLSARGAVAQFLAHDLSLEVALARDHLAMHGSRAWWAPRATSSWSEMLELGERDLPRCAAFHVDHALLLRALLERVERAGVELRRGASVEQVVLGRPRSQLEVREAGGSSRTEATWVIDASGSAARLSPQRSRCGLRLSTSQSRWRGLRPWSEFSELAPTAALRALAEHDFSGRGWRARLAPLRGGEHDLLLALDPEVDASLHAEFEGARSLQAHSRFLRSRAGLRELLRTASVAPESFRTRELESAYATPACGPGWAAVGDAAGELDPFDGAPLRQLVETARGAAQLITGNLSGKRLDAARDSVERAEHFRDEFRRRACRLGEGAYELFGDAELRAAAHGLDLAYECSPLLQRFAHAPRAWLRARLIRQARERSHNGLYGLAPARRRGPLRSSAGAQARRALAAWLAVEFASFREHFTPAPDLGPTSVSAALSAYAAKHGVR